MLPLSDYKIIVVECRQLCGSSGGTHDRIVDEFSAFSVFQNLSGVTKLRITLFFRVYAVGAGRHDILAEQLFLHSITVIIIFTGDRMTYIPIIIK